MGHIRAKHSWMIGTMNRSFKFNISLIQYLINAIFPPTFQCVTKDTVAAGKEIILGERLLCTLRVGFSETSDYLLRETKYWTDRNDLTKILRFYLFSDSFYKDLYFG